MRKRRISACLALCLALCLGTACAQEADAPFHTSGRVREEMPLLDITIRDTGAPSDDMLRDRLLSVSILAQDGSLSQTMTYASGEDPSRERAAAMARLEDLNFDGYLDLLLLTAAGARNVFTVFALWNPEAGQFDPVMEHVPWLPAENRFGDEAVPLELCNPVLLPQTRQIYSCVEDGFYYRTQIAYGWEGDDFLCEDSVAYIYDAGGGTIGEKLHRLGTQIALCWDMQYPEDWYYGQDAIARERSAVLDYMMQGDALTNPAFLTVANTDWVHLRMQDSTASPSLAKLDAGVEVQVLQTGCGTDGGWVRVWLSDLSDGRIAVDDAFLGAPALTGYIWHSFLQ